MTDDYQDRKDELLDLAAQGARLGITGLKVGCVVWCIAAAIPLIFLFIFVVALLASGGK